MFWEHNVVLDFHVNRHYANLSVATAELKWLFPKWK